MPREVPIDPDILELLLHREESGSSEVDRERIIDAVEALPKAKRELVNALFWEGLSVREYATRLGVNRRLVEQRLRQALGDLRKKLQ